MTPREFLDRIERIYRERGHAEYHGEAVSQLEHALQAAWLAEQDGQPAAIIAAALLHDLGHLLHTRGEGCAAQGVDTNHETLGIRFLESAFGPDVTEPIRLHVAAKRYLCSTDATYLAKLSPASVRSLELQGGLMLPLECKAFQAARYFEAAVHLRRYDDRAKVVGLTTPDFRHFAAALEDAIRGEKP